MQTMKITRTELIQKKDRKVLRYPNLNTVLMVEEFLAKHRDAPMQITEIKEKLPRQVMHQTLKLIFEYLWKSGKIMYGPRGIQWIYAEPAHLKKMLEGSLEV